MEPKIVPEFNDAWNQKLRDHLQNAHLRSEQSLAQAASGYF